MTSGTGKDGFTLVEILVSVAILSVGSVAVLQALGRSAAALAVAESRSQAHLFSMAKMAEVELAVRSGKRIEEATAGSFREGPRQFSWSLTAHPPPEEDPQMQSVSLIVHWDLGRRRYEYAVETAFRLPKEEGEAEDASPS